ncbi:MAG: sigma-54 dependent transcriptional regulator [Desulfobulbaceae bacterium]|nr:sigma-54 dependent transcriptional regulator [Desulfobulbaceae bacterium]HIJ78902.1 sigma-54-dependent Fis family transcriptional regulator [Deltaproteobacteria bacterium]
MSETGRKILVVDDEQNMRIALYEALSRGGHEVSVAENGSMALEMIRKSRPELLITDIKMPVMDGIELLRQVKALVPELPVVIITGYATVDTAVEAMKQGAFDYILKPFPVEIIEETVLRVFGGKTIRPHRAVPSVSAKAAGMLAEKPIIGRNPKLLQLMSRAKTVASSKATVLILGESGTGKEVFARYIHQESDRRDGPFVALNCAALPEGLLESELFGHEKGAFTGAIVSKKGKFELADGGTLLLDEIGEIPLHLQAKLLRVLQEEEVDRLGGRAPVKVDVHVLATTNRDLEEAVKEGTFRQDLYYRLNVIPLKLPALRERPEDIELLAEFFIAKYSGQYGKAIKKLSKGSRERFACYGWPGNVREMENLIERAVLLSMGNELDLWDFWDDVEVPAEALAAPDLVVDSGPPVESAFAVEAANTSAALDGGLQPLRDVERQMILQALDQTDNNRTHAANILGISVRTLRNKLHEYRSQGLIS